MAMRRSCWTCQPRSGWVRRLSQMRRRNRLSGSSKVRSQDGSRSRSLTTDAARLSRRRNSATSRSSTRMTCRDMPVTKRSMRLAQQPAALEIRRVARRHDRRRRPQRRAVRPRAAASGTNRLFIAGSAAGPRPQNFWRATRARKIGIADDVAAPQPAGLDDQAEQPFEAQLPHPQRGARHGAADEIEQRADGHRHGAMAPA